MTTNSKDALTGLAELMDGFRLSQCIHVAAQLRLADALDDSSRSTEELAHRVEANPDALRRLLRALSSFGVFQRSGADGWENSSMSRLLRTADPSAMADRASTLGTLAWAPWGALLHSVRTGAPAFDHVFDQPFFAHLAEHPEQAASFGRTMTSFTRQTAEAVVAAHDFSAYRHIVDIGGGHGVMLDVLLSRHADARATLVDRPEVVATGAPELRDEVRHRCELVAADFFRDELPSTDAYLLSWILHDWGEDDCVRLLQRCAQAMSITADLIIVEMVIDDDVAPGAAKMFDLEMLVQTGGKERSLDQFREIISAAGLQLTACRPTQGPHSVLVCRKG